MRTTGVRIALVAMCGALAIGMFGGVAAASQTATTVLNGTQFTDTQGRMHTLAQWRGKLVLVNFWATWCPPCRRELPTLEAAQKRFGARGFQIIGPAVDDADTVRQELQLLGINYPAMVSTPAAMKALMIKLGDTRVELPFSVFVAPDGRIVQTHAGALDPHTLDSLANRYLPD